MPNRILREGILTSRRVNRLSERSEIFYRRLMSRLDDYGRCEADAELMRTACYPLRVDKVKAAQIESWLLEMETAVLVVIYFASGKRYLQYLDWNQQERTSSKFPAPPEHLIADAKQKISNAEQVPANAHLVVDVVVGGSVPPRRPVKTPLPEGFCVSPRVEAWAAERGLHNLHQHFEAFVSKCKAKDYRYADWDEALMGAIRGNWAGIVDGGKKKVAL